MMLIQDASTRVRHADITRRTRHDWTHASAGQETQGPHRRRSRRTCLHPLAPTRRDHHQLAGLLRIPHRLAHRHRIHPAVPHSYLGDPDNWGFAIYQASTGTYIDSQLPNGADTGTPTQALDTALGLYLNDPTAWQLEPPKD